MNEEEAKASLELAKRQLEKVQASWDDPTDWSDLSLYGFYCLENAVKAAALHFNIAVSRKHFRKAQIADQLTQDFDLPDVSEFLKTLNSARKAASYGDIDFPEGLGAEDTASEIEAYVLAVSKLIEGVE